MLWKRIKSVVIFIDETCFIGLLTIMTGAMLLALGKGYREETSWLKRYHQSKGVSNQ